MTLKLFLYEKGLDAILKNKISGDYNEYKIQRFKKNNLSALQTKSYQEVSQNINFSSYSTTLVHGVTGSGKTLIYFEIIKEALKKNKQVLVLLPEIALTKQIAERFKDYFEAEPALWHSSISEKKKKNIWKGVSENKIKLVLGARSSIFLPFQNLKLIVIDEEHDSSYKQEEGVSYNARDMSILRASIEKFPILLVSATPSIESYYNSKNKKYFYVSLTERYKNISLPNIEIVDLVNAPADKGKFISNQLIPKLKKIIKEKQQVLFFLNRRGHSTYIMCYECKKKISLPELFNRTSFSPNF